MGKYENEKNGPKLKGSISTTPPTDYTHYSVALSVYKIVYAVCTLFLCFLESGFHRFCDMYTWQLEMRYCMLRLPNGELLYLQGKQPSDLLVACLYYQEEKLLEQR